METRIHYVPNGDGWKLAVKQIVDPQRLDRSRRPLLIVPGYGMNAFIFGYHPNGLSLEEYLAQAGFEVFSVNLRTQGPSIRVGGSLSYGMRETSLVDLPAAINFVCSHNSGGHDKLDIIGCSLGGTKVYAYAGLIGTEKLGNIITLGAPLRWVEIHPVLKLAFRSELLAGLIRMKHTRTLARFGLPLLTHLPGLLSIYLHPEIVDLSHPEILTQTVEDPNPMLNREIVRWVKSVDLMIDGRNVTASLRRVKNPLLVMLCNADGIVPPQAALAALDAVGSEVKDTLTAGTDAIPMAHADMYISYHAQDQVFQPLVEWLRAHP
jgi:polyhydroxyalkanoate synthase